MLLLLRILLVSVSLADEVIEEFVQGFHSRSARAIVVLLFSQVICGEQVRRETMVRIPSFSEPCLLAMSVVLVAGVIKRYPTKEYIHQR